MTTDQIRVAYLNRNIKQFSVSPKTLGEELLSRVYQDLGLLETDYFGLNFTDYEENLRWLDPLKTLKGQGVYTSVPRMNLNFGVKFFPQDPGECLNEEITRYLFVLELKKSLKNGSLNCTDTMKIFFLACLVQAEFGDYDVDECSTTDYISALNLICNPSDDMLERIRDLHRQRSGQKPFEADYALLEKMKCIETYGARPAACTDSHGANCKLSPSSKGILVFQQKSLVQTWSWNLIRKISFKQKTFLIKLRREDGTPSDTKYFSFQSRNAAKIFWKYSIENHSFFHLKTCIVQKRKTMVSKGSRFRYSGKTQEELKIAVSRNPRQNNNYQRKTSIRKSKNSKGQINSDYKTLHGEGDLSSTVLPPVEPVVPESPDVTLQTSSILEKQHNFTHELKPEATEEEPVYDEPRKLRYDYNYSVCKELCMTERTHLHDLEVIVCHLRNALKDESGIPGSVLSLLYTIFDPIYSFHKGFLGSLEQRVAEWEQEENNGNSISDFLYGYMKQFARFEVHFIKLESVMEEIESALQSYPQFLQSWRTFESRKLCYLPLISFFNKPVCRLFYYQKVIKRMKRNEGVAALQELAGPVKNLEPVLIECLQFQIQSQLRRELIGAERLVSKGRKFIREGYLRKWAGARGGFNARMFFLFNDCILWTSSKIEPPTVGNVVTKPWKLSVELPLNDVTVELSDMERSAPHSFAINIPDSANTNENKVTSLILSSLTQNQRNKWVSDIEHAATVCKGSIEPFYSTTTGQPSASYHLRNISPAFDNLSLSESKVKQNTTTQVCWFRYCTLSFEDHINMSQNVMSGYLMRKFKNKPTNKADPGKFPTRNWQKLWVVLNNFSIHFYKRHQESAPLAHLPLLEYSVKAIDPKTIPSCKHQYVFMIKLKKHEYHFAAETEYFFNRWMESLQTATLNSDE